MNGDANRNTNSTELDYSNRGLPSIKVAGDFVMKAGTGLGPRQLKDYELLYFPDGTRSVYTVDQRTYILNEPCFILTRPNETHTYIYDPIQPSRHLFVHFDFNQPSSAVLPLPILLPGEPSYIPIIGELLPAMMKQILTITYTLPNRIQQRGGALLLALLEELNGLLSDKPAEPDSNQMPLQIIKALEYIDKHLEESISIEQLAHKVGWTHEHLSRSFVRYTSRTPREVIIQRRVERACQLLIYEEKSVKQIAYTVGFSDENYFCRVFKVVKGVTATAYRKKYYNPKYRDLYPVQDGDSLYPANRILFPRGS
ncbi:helix-turn-helix domain-containing protein [Paenibacillus solisilvae]|uniref:Helix-turn-helix domain-containing protein n=1 Tax=Paenibacillus solisilvae TaxID=2486751 RepID=A0ABW0VZ40_9BACL